jgi:hypothetical protein
MSAATIAIETRGRHRALGLKTWLGAGALTVGVGAALAAGAGAAQADTGGHASSGSNSSSNHDAGPKRTGTATSARTVAKVTTTPVSAAATASSSPKAQSKAKANATAAQTAGTTQTINTPFGPISVTISATLPDAGSSGPVSMDVNASTPVGGIKLALAGTSTFTASPLKQEIAISTGTLQVPRAMAFLASGLSSAVAGGLAAYDSYTTFMSAVQSGNVGGAILAWAEAAPKFTTALLFGSNTLTLPLSSGGSGPSIEVHIPVGGLFSPLRSVSVSWDDYSYVDGTTGAEIELDAADITFAGTKFGGAAATFLQLLHLA